MGALVYSRLMRSTCSFFPPYPILQALNNILGPKGAVAGCLIAHQALATTAA